MLARRKQYLLPLYLLCTVPHGTLGQSSLIPGPASDEVGSDIVNPYENDPDALRDGGRLFDWYNCSGCHAPQGAGGMGPPLSDDKWIYGGDPADVFNSIWRGRPAGMPTWANRIPPDEIWKIINYI